MTNDSHIQKCISIRKDQQLFLDNEKTTFKFSKFVQAKLDGYIKMRKEYEEFAEKEV